MHGRGEAENFVAGSQDRTTGKPVSQGGELMLLGLVPNSAEMHLLFNLLTNETPTL